MYPLKRLTAALVVLLCIQQASEGQLQPGYSSPASSDSFRSSEQGTPRTFWHGPAVQHQSETGNLYWANMSDVSTGFLNETQPDVSCASGNQMCGYDDCRHREFWQHRSRYFGEFLYLTARDSRLPYATHVDGPVPGAASLAPASELEPDFESGFRVGGAIALDPWSSITATYWFFESEITDSLVLPGNIGWARSEVTHPGTAAIANDSLSARARDEISFRMGDVAFQRVWWGDCATSIDWLLGIRYAHLNQRFHGDFVISGRTTVDTEIDFEGLGPRAGILLERRLSGGFLAYGNAIGNLLVGELATSYIQQNATAGNQATSGFNDDRIVPQVEAELGISWQNDCGNLRLNAGYFLGNWFNVGTTPAWIDAVQTDNASDMDDSLLIHGLTFRAEFRF